VWSAMAELGLLGLTVPEAYGGLGGGAVDAMTLMEAIGDALLLEPWLATVGMGARIVARGGSDAERERMLPSVVQGTATLACAFAEPGSGYALSHVTCRAARDGGDYVVTGTKGNVAHGAAADALVVSVRTSGEDTSSQGITALLVSTTAPGVQHEALRMLDGTRAARVTFDHVRVPRDAIIGTPDHALPLIEETVDFATALVCAEAVGAIGSANAATLEYLKTREQFGRPIGAFQALQHRMVDMVIEHEQARSMASLACSGVDRETDPRSRARTVSAAKMRIGEACRKVSQESIQLHGGMGMSDELKVSHTFRRLTAIAQQFGDEDHHLGRFIATSRASA
jgi:alkylation response protein AidB-like acyl-CoA dehydrogenase